MLYLLMGFAVFFIVTSLQNVVEAPTWAWTIAVFVLGIAATALWGQIHHWYVGLAVAGISTIILRVENLLLIKADETVANLRRRR